ncbi:MAG: hypothetical protein K8T89_05345 [Planctomycetes bacterium]|nr:hypothetical protein [Planctomycetota bacterium]
MIRSIAIVGILILFTAPARSEPRDVAELFPADAPLYIEINQIGTVAKDLAAFLKGTVLANPNSNLEHMKTRPNEDSYVDTSPRGIISVMVAPVMLKESSQFKGFAVAVTGFTKHGDPEYLAVLLAGASPLPGHVMKTFFRANNEIQKLATVEGIDLYQGHNTRFVGDPLVDAKPDAAKAILIGPVYAYGPGLVVVGSTKDLVTSAIRRFKEKEKAESLAATPRFKASADQRALPGIFVNADARTLLKRLANKDRQEFDPLASFIVRKLLPSESVETLTARIEIKESSINVIGNLKFDPKISNPAADLLTGPGLEAGDLNFFAKDSRNALVVSLPKGAERLPRLLGVLDIFVKSTGTLGPTASEMVAELVEKKSIALEDLANVDRITLVQPPAGDWLKAPSAIPTILLRTEKPEAAEAIVTAMPAILEYLGVPMPEAIIETIDGIKVRSFAGRISTFGSIHLAVKENLLAIGIDRKHAAACIAAVSTKANAEILKLEDKPALVASWHYPRLASRVAKTNEGSGRSGQTPPRIILDNEPLIIQLPRSAMNTPRSFQHAFGGLPPIIFTAGRGGNEIRFTLQQRDPEKVRVKVVEQLLNWMENVSNGSYRGTYYDAPPLLEIR